MRDVTNSEPTPRMGSGARRGRDGGGRGGARCSHISSAAGERRRAARPPAWPPHRRRRGARPARGGARPAADAASKRHQAVECTVAVLADVLRRVVLHQRDVARLPMATPLVGRHRGSPQQEAAGGLEGVEHAARLGGIDRADVGRVRLHLEVMARRRRSPSASSSRGVGPCEGEAHAGLAVVGDPGVAGREPLDALVLRRRAHRTTCSASASRRHSGARALLHTHERRERRVGRLERQPHQLRRARSVNPSRSSSTTADERSIVLTLRDCLTHATSWRVSSASTASSTTARRLSEASRSRRPTVFPQPVGPARRIGWWRKLESRRRARRARHCAPLPRARMHSEGGGARRPDPPREPAGVGPGAPRRAAAPTEGSEEGPRGRAPAGSRSTGVVAATGRP